MRNVTRILAAVAAAVLSVGMFAAAPALADEPVEDNGRHSPPVAVCTTRVPTLERQVFTLERTVRQLEGRLDRKNETIKQLRNRVARLRDRR